MFLSNNFPNLNERVRGRSMFPLARRLWWVFWIIRMTEKRMGYGWRARAWVCETEESKRGGNTRRIKFCCSAVLLMFWSSCPASFLLYFILKKLENWTLFLNHVPMYAQQNNWNDPMNIHFKAKSFKNTGLSIYVQRKWHCLFHSSGIKLLLNQNYVADTTWLCQLFK